MFLIKPFNCFNQATSSITSYPQDFARFVQVEKIVPIGVKDLEFLSMSIYAFVIKSQEQLHH